MSQEASGEPEAPEAPDAPVVDEAPPPDEPVEEVVVEDSPDPAEREEASLADAFAEAKAELQGTKAPDAPDETSAASSQPASDDTTVVEPTSQTFDLTSIRRAIETGQEATLPLEGRQLTKAMRERMETERAEEAKFKDYYLELAAEAVEDPDAYIARTRADPTIAQFVHAYEKANPDVTLETPNGAGPDPARLRAQIDAEYVTTIVDMAEFLARENGVDNFAALKANAGNKVGALLQTTFNEAVKKATAKELPALVAQERIAITAELTAKFANSRVMSPRSLNGVPVNGAASKPSDPDENPLRASFEEAKLELAKR